MKKLEDIINKGKKYAKNAAVTTLFGLGLAGAYSNQVQAQTNDCAPCTTTKGTPVILEGEMRSTNRGMTAKDRSHYVIDNGGSRALTRDARSPIKSAVKLGNGDGPYDICLDVFNGPTEKATPGKSFGNQNFVIDVVDERSINITNRNDNSSIQHMDLALYRVPEGASCRASNSQEAVPFSIYLLSQGNNFDGDGGSNTNIPSEFETMYEDKKNAISITGGVNDRLAPTFSANISRKIGEDWAINAGAGYSLGYNEQTEGPMETTVLNDDPTVRSENRYVRETTDLQSAVNFSLGLDYKNIGVSGVLEQNNGQWLNQEITDRVGWNGTTAPGSSVTTTDEESNSWQYGIEGRVYVPVSDAVKLKVKGQKMFGESNLGSNYNVQAGLQLRW